MEKYKNKKYSLSQFYDEYARAKENDKLLKIPSFQLDAYAIFRYEDNLKVPIWYCFNYNEAVGFAHEDSKETDGKYKHYSIEGIGCCATRVVAMFTTTFFNTITSDYRKRIKDVQIDIDDNAKILKSREDTQDTKERERWIRQEKYFEDID